MRGLNPRQIEAFRAVVLTGGVSAAASLINVTLSLIHISEPTRPY